MERISKKTWLLLGLALAVVVVIVAVLANKDSSVKPTDRAVTERPAQSDVAGGEDGDAVSMPDAVDSILAETVVVVPGANPINKENKVITTSGEEVKTDVSASSPVAPQQTLAVEKEALAASVIKLDVSLEKFSPDSFTVKAGAPITISITNLESDRSVTLGFADPSLVGVVMGAGPSETRAITFNAPSTPGEYIFMDGIPGRSATGKMIVQ